MAVGGKLFTPGKETRYPLYRRLGGLQGRSGRVREILTPLGFNLRTVQLLVSRYTSWAIAAHTALNTQWRSPMLQHALLNIACIYNETTSSWCFAGKRLKAVLVMGLLISVQLVPEGGSPYIWAYTL